MYLRVNVPFSKMATTSSRGSVFVLKMTAMTSLKVTLLDCYDLGTLLTSAVVSKVKDRETKREREGQRDKDRETRT